MAIAGVARGPSGPRCFRGPLVCAPLCVLRAPAEEIRAKFFRKLKENPIDFGTDTYHGAYPCMATYHGAYPCMATYHGAYPGMATYHGAYPCMATYHSPGGWTRLELKSDSQGVSRFIVQEGQVL